ncbi:hypothetical protein [Burkholderia gladioli]|uniref:hypothetical protein n=2 Tax=Burkholderia gladioli TaxID=28095 RepID=UPI000F51B2F6|nr:hypothetical protein [Burkholderia gladioli]MBJ9714119.1 hypothetical protein [Burkholderia gladioli]MBU9157521.1 hypothetical protein [Burkholderia gladioli]MBU9217938.1 hypothetical protein [Burkholderia gladioli]MCH7272250.1 hypothetical protein [Burkholderia gladioli]MDN7725788.1 hypothetical protein [Burkholderia gladioli]
MKTNARIFPLLSSIALLASCAPPPPPCDQLCQNINMDRMSVSAGMLDPRFLQYDVAEQKARQDLKQAIADHDTHRAQVLQAVIDDITKKRNALDIAQRPQAQRQLQEQRQRLIETMHNAPPMSNVDPGAYARSRVPVQGGNDSEEIERRVLEQQQQFDDMVRREHGQ